MGNAMEIDGGFYSSLGSLIQYDWYPPPDNIEYVEASNFDYENRDCSC